MGGTVLRTFERLAFVLVAVVSLLGLIDSWRLQAGSGDHLSKKASA